MADLSSPKASTSHATEEHSSSSEEEIKPGVTVKTTYENAPVEIPADFLTTSPPDAQPMTISAINWASSVLPENAGRYAVVLDNVLSASECAELLQLAEASVPESKRGTSGARFWRPALVNVGNGFEAFHPNYRNSDRIIWDNQEIVDRLWDRCLLAPGLKERLAVIENEESILGPIRKGGRQRWNFRRLNDRMRFLKYGPGQFFRPHFDGEYWEPGEKITKSLFTVHLYLSDSKQTVGDEAELEGGATSFLSVDGRKMDVDPKAGRVLIFQHRRLYHSGDDVIAGTKYTMRTDIMYEMVAP